MDWEKVAESLDKAGEDAASERRRFEQAPSMAAHRGGLIAAEWVFVRLAQAIRDGQK